MSEFEKIVENILKEDGYKDKKRMLEAMHIYEDAVQSIETELKKQNKPFVIDIAGDTITEIQTPHGKLTVAFSLQEDGNANGLYLSNHSYIQINIPAIVDLEDNIINGIHKETKEEYFALPTDMFVKIINSRPLQETFVHEYTHFVDDKTAFPLFMSNASKKNINADYFNNTNELNAHCIEWLYNISIELVERNDKLLQKLSPDERLEFLKKYWKENESFLKYYNALQPEHKKKFMKRIYNYLTTL